MVGLAVWLLLAPPPLVRAGTTVKGQEVGSDTPWPEKQKLRDDSTAEKIALAPVRVLAWPGRQLLAGMESGLLYVEDNRVLVKIAQFQQRLAARGFFPQYGGLGDGAGFGGGLTVRRGGRSPAAPYASLKAAASIKNFHEYELAFGAPVLAGPLGARASAFFSYQPQEDFFGLGRGAAIEDRTTYLNETIGAALALALRPGRGFALGATGRLRRVNIGEGTDPRFPATQQEFTAAEAPGLARGADLVSLEGEVAHDGADRPGAPSRGGRAALGAGIFEAVDGQAIGYARYHAELTRYLSLYPGRVLAFRALGVVTDRRGREEEAFFDLPELGGSTSMRGFREHRFRDRDAVLFNLEYRWLLTGWMEAALFADEGQVFENLEDEFQFGRLRTSWGGSVRLRSMNGVFFNYQAGHSREGTRHFFKFTGSF